MKNRKYPTNNVYWFIPERFEYIFANQANKKREKLLSRYKEKLTNKNFSLIVDCCMGGVLYHELGLQFKSPFINLSVSTHDYLKLLKNLDYYLKQDIAEIPSKESYPLGSPGGGIILRFHHYKNFGEARDAWNRRKIRVDFNNLFLIMTDGYGNLFDSKERISDDDFKEFLALPYKKLFVTNDKNKKKIKSNEVIYLKKYRHNYMVYPYHINLIGKGERMLEEYFDIISWLNN